MKYYNDLFSKFKNDMKKTWDTIKSVLNRPHSKKDIPESLIIDGKEINDRITIAEKFNDFFINVGPKFAAKINCEGKKSFTTYLNQECEQNSILVTSSQKISFSFLFQLCNKFLYDLATLQCTNC